MRDPSAQVIFRDDVVLRRFHDLVPPTHFLRSKAARELVDSGRLIDYRFVDDETIESPKLPFITYPHEWTDAQLSDAAKLTLGLCEDLLTHGCELKDASAWNVVFQGTHPVFCDHSSIQPVGGPRWEAFGQFVRHFIFPLVLSRYRKLNAHQAFLLSRDGLSQEQTSDLLGLRRFATRYWPLMLRSRPRSHTRSGREDGGEPGYHRNLYALLAWYLKNSSVGCESSSRWLGYTQDRSHYEPEAVAIKRSTIDAWLRKIRPRCTVDLGCNTGEFSRMARAAGSKVICIDADHQCVEHLYKSFRGDEGMFPVVGRLDDLCGGRGWSGDEFPGLGSRLAGLAQVGILLGLTHHLAISDSIPYDSIVNFAGHVAPIVFVEFIHEKDPMIAALCAGRNRRPEEFSFDAQRNAFSRSFRVADEVRLPGGLRSLALLERL